MDNSFKYDLEDDDWQPDELATTRPAEYRINTWEKTYLGKDYQELRVQKRERKQPQIIQDLPYLHSDRMNAPPYGPYYSLETRELEQIDQPIKKSDQYKASGTRPDSSNEGGKMLSSPSLAHSTFNFVLIKFSKTLFYAFTYMISKEKIYRLIYLLFS